MAVIHLLCKQVASCSEEKLLCARSDIKGLFGENAAKPQQRVGMVSDLQECQTQTRSRAKM